jgi:hypothetical protein
MAPSDTLREKITQAYEKVLEGTEVHLSDGLEEEEIQTTELVLEPDVTTAFEGAQTEEEPMWVI